MPTYKIPITWESYTRIEVEADDLQEALKKAYAKFLTIPDENYIEDSAEFDTVVFEEHNEEADPERAISDALSH